MPELQATVESSTQMLQNQRNRRTASAEETTALERTLAEHRENQEDMRQTKSEHEIRFTEISMRRQNLLERVLSEYQMTSDHIAKEAEPDWKGDPPSTDDIDTRIGELRTKLDAMGPVNLVAIEEYQEFEDRYEFLTHQQDDLVNAKRQLIELIQKINRTTSELFTATFNQINTNFLETFQKLFDGGTAKLVLVNDEDVLESGIEIIARPPGKRLQNVTLLSGGERTMTAVALLFAIYMIKPSPFCVLDELDAALDESNIGRFVDMVHGFLSLSQFLVVTHNQKTIAAADILYGITMAKNSGISQVVSMKLSDHDAPTLAEQVDTTQDVSTPAS
jgi:chromosome segregation protein